MGELSFLVAFLEPANGILELQLRFSKCRYEAFEQAHFGKIDRLVK
jgi:hypothetical protein